MTSEITHRGFVSAVADGSVKVSLFRPAACGSCLMKGHCGAEHEHREHFEIEAQGYALGDEVQLTMSTGTGLGAVLVAYIIPFIVLMLALITSLQLALSEGMSAVISLLAVGLYYVILKMASATIRHHFSIHIKKLQPHE